MGYRNDGERGTLEYFRWLHLSDIHHVNTAENEKLHREFLEKIKTEIRTAPIDCIVMTGDFAYQGIIDAGVYDFVSEIYSICSNAGNWGWETGKNMDRLFTCPGNHDLNRNAAIEDADLYRPEILPELAEKCKTEFMDSSASEYDLMTTHAFRPYRIFVEKSKAQKLSGTYPYEYNIFKVPGQYTPDPVRFIGINTELLAGQLRAKDVIQQELAEQYSEFMDAHRRFDFQKAREIYEQYCEGQKELIEGNVAKDEKRLCFISEEARKSAEEEIKKVEGAPIVILFGHRSIEAFSEEAQQREANFASACNQSQIYLCGHSHKPGRSKIVTRFLNNNSIQHQICVGGSFADPSGYNTCSFSIGTITWRNGQPPEMRDTLYIWEKLFDPASADGTTEKPYHWIECPAEEPVKLTIHSDFGRKPEDEKVLERGEEKQKKIPEKMISRIKIRNCRIM